LDGVREILEVKPTDAEVGFLSAGAERGD